MDKEKVLMKNNVIVKSRYSLSLIESRVFTTMLYKLQKKSDGSLTCDITQDEFKEIIGHKSQKTIKGIKEVLNNMMDSRIYFIQENKENNDVKWGEYHLIGGYEYSTKTKTFTLSCVHRVYDLITNYIEVGYTPINLKIYLSLNNPNSQRLYELLRLWSNSKNIINYRVEEIRELFMLENKYENYKDLRRRIIEPAIKELNNTQMFDINFEEKKKGRRVDSIDFNVKDLDKRVYFQEKFDIFDEKSDKNEEKIVNNVDVFIPDKSVFTVGTLRAFKSDFKDYDFNNRYLEMAFNDAVNIALERDDTEKIYMKSYNYFKGSLKNKIDYYMDQEMQDEEHMKNLEQYWPQ